jgi:ribosomal protein L6P/L9E
VATRLLSGSAAKIRSFREVVKEKGEKVRMRDENSSHHSSSPREHP